MKGSKQLLSLGPWPIWREIRPGVYCMGDSAHALYSCSESGESPFS